MKRYWLVVGTVSAVMIAAYFAATAAGLAIEQPGRLLSRPGALAALTGVALLAVDVVAPVPSSLVMVANGALFGALLGSLLSTAGSLAGFSIAFWLGRRGGPLLRRLVGEQEDRRAGALLERHGAVAIAATRPIPILAETTALLAGASPLPWGRAVLAAATGIVPQAVIYGIAGALAASFTDGSLVFIAVLLATGLMWLVTERIGARMGPAKDSHRHQLS